ncbi:MAG TPA: glycosyltransferase, partial [Acidobacteriota bacterium]|nr:glycosyltransferase [Acidobacteriota bacterium]
KLLHDLCTRLDRNRFHITICLLRRQGDFVDMMFRDFPGDVSAFDLGSPLRWWKVLELIRFLKRKRFDVIQAFGFRSDLISRMVKFGTSKPSLIGFVPNPELPNAKLKALTNYFSSGLVDRFWADCEYRSRHGSAKLRIPAEKIGVIYPGIDSTAPADPSAVRTELNISPDTPVVGAVGNLRFVK